MFAADQITIKNLKNCALINDECMSSDGRIHIYINVLLDIVDESEIKESLSKKLVR